MRDVKYDKESAGDDIKYAFEYNGLSAHLDAIDVIIAEVCGENDGCDWYWVLLLKDGKFALAQGGCDCTGWDCQSNAAIDPPVDTWEEAISIAPEVDSYGRLIRDTLRSQILGETPFALYTAEHTEKMPE